MQWWLDGYAGDQCDYQVMGFPVGIFDVMWMNGNIIEHFWKMTWNNFQWMDEPYVDRFVAALLVICWHLSIGKSTTTEESIGNMARGRNPICPSIQDGQLQSPRSNWIIFVAKSSRSSLGLGKQESRSSDDKKLISSLNIHYYQTLELHPNNIESMRRSEMDCSKFRGKPTHC